MKIVFAGPSLAGANVHPADIVLRPPAAQGDVLQAVDDGANIIGIVDGYFGWTASVWHKEILYALSLGVRVFGASSMGALRAAECQDFGMVAVGEIAMAYAAGELDDDDLVALTHLPAEFDYLPTTEPLVDALPTIAAMRQRGAISRETAGLLEERARSLHFAARTVEALSALDILDEAHRHELCTTYEAHRVNAKQHDAIALIDLVKSLPNSRVSPPEDWVFAETPMWRHHRSHAFATQM